MGPSPRWPSSFASLCCLLEITRRSALRYILRGCRSRSGALPGPEVLRLGAPRRDRDMIYVTQLVYIREGQEESFQQFEDLVLPLLGKYGGELVLRLRPGPGSLIGGTSECPYEVHVIRFEREEDIERYSNDEVRQRNLHLKERAVRRVLVMKGVG